MTRANASLALWLRLALVAALVILLEIYARFFADPAFISPPSAISSGPPNIIRAHGFQNARTCQVGLPPSAVSGRSSPSTT